MNKNDFENEIDNLKRKDKNYIKELQILFDRIENIQDEELRNQILYGIHRCEKMVLEICYKLIKN